MPPHNTFIEKIYAVKYRNMKLAVRLSPNEYYRAVDGSEKYRLLIRAIIANEHNEMLHSVAGSKYDEWTWSDVEWDQVFFHS